MLPLHYTLLDITYLREIRVKMAAKADSPSNFSGQPWSSWAEAVALELTNSEIENAKLKSASDCMKLKKEDMILFGLFPSQDEFLLVVCEECGQVVKPQAIQTHMQLKHKKCLLETNELNSVSSNYEQERTKSALQSKQDSKLFNKILSQGKIKKQSLASNPLPSAQQPPPKSSHSILKKSVNHVYVNDDSWNLESKLGLIEIDNGLSSESRGDSQVSNCVISDKVPVSENLSNGDHFPSNSIVPSDNYSHKFSSSNQENDRDVKRKVKSDKKSCSNKEREYNPDKHCGVWIIESKKPCLRSLTCKSHPLSLRRKVAGRSKKFDVLLAEHRAAKEGSTLKERFSESSSSHAVSQVCKTTAYPKPMSQGPGPPKLHSPQPQCISSPDVSSNMPYLPLESPPCSRVSGYEALSKKEDFGEALFERKLENGLSESIENDVEEEESDLMMHINRPLFQHPRPHSICTFGAKLVGGSLLPDRRYCIYRSAFQTSLGLHCLSRSMPSSPFPRTVSTPRMGVISSPLPEPVTPDPMRISANVFMSGTTKRPAVSPPKLLPCAKKSKKLKPSPSMSPSGEEHTTLPNMVTVPSLSSLNMVNNLVLDPGVSGGGSSHVVTVTIPNGLCQAPRTLTIPVSGALLGNKSIDVTSSSDCSAKPNPSPSGGIVLDSLIKDKPRTPIRFEVQGNSYSQSHSTGQLQPKSKERHSRAFITSSSKLFSVATNKPATPPNNAPVQLNVPQIINLTSIPPQRAIQHVLSQLQLHGSARPRLGPTGVPVRLVNPSASTPRTTVLPLDKEES